MIRSLLAIVCLLALGDRSSAIEITSCQFKVNPGETGDLTIDLADCTLGIKLASGATLRMNGHSIVARSSPRRRGMGIKCRGGCSIVGPGEVSASGGFAIQQGKQSAALSIRDVNIADSGTGIAGGKITAANLSIVRCQTAAIRGVVVTGSNIAVFDNAAGIVCDNAIVVERLTATENRAFGLMARNLTLTDSIAVRNGIDVLSANTPVLIRSTCGTSVNTSSGGQPFSVCNGERSASTFSPLSDER